MGARHRIRSLHTIERSGYHIFIHRGKFYFLVWEYKPSKVTDSYPMVFFSMISYLREEIPFRLTIVDSNTKNVFEAKTLSEEDSCRIACIQRMRFPMLAGGAVDKHIIVEFPLAF